VIYALQVAEYDSRLRAQSALLERTLEAAEFFTSGPLLNLGPETPEVLLELAEAARDDFAEDPNGQAQILSTVGDIYAGIGLFTLASEHYAEAATAIESMKLDSAAAVDLRIAQLRSLEYDFQAERSIELGESLLTQAAVLGDPIRSARVRSMLSSSYAFLQMDEAQAELEERFGAVTDQVETALQGLKVGADAPEQKLELRRLLARELLNERRFEEALEAATQTLDEHVALYGREDLRTLMAAYQRGRSLGRLWANRSLRSVESQPPLEFAQAILEEARGWAGETSRVALEMRWLVAEFQLSSGQPGRAFENYDFVARHYGKWIGEENPRYLSLLCARAITATKLGAAQQAVETLDRVIEVRERVVGADHFNTLIARRARAEALLRLGRFEEAEHEFVRVWERFRSQGGFRGTEGIVHSAFYLGDTLTHLGRFEEGIEWLRRTQEILSEEQGPEEALDIAYYSNWLEMLDALLRRDPQGLNSVVAATKSRFPEKSVDVRPFEIAGALLAGDALPPSRAELLADASHVAVEVAAIELAREYAAGDVERARSLAQRVNLEGAAYGRLWNEGYTPSMQVLSQLLASAMREAVGEDLLPIERQILQRLDVE
jgi:tetratricopeptide (TPR) repeat protein